MSVIPTPAKTVVYRHPCDCAGASRPLADGEKPEHRFDVDGETFPWLLPADPQPKFTQLLDDLWRIDLTIWCIPTDGRDEELRCPKPRFLDMWDTAFSDVSGSGCGTPMIAGIEFPWAISTEGITYQHSHKTLPSVTLAFFAEHVDTDGPFDDQRHLDQTIIDNGANLWHMNAQEKALRDRLYAATEDWPTGPDGMHWNEITDDENKVVAIIAHHPDGRELRFD